MNSYCCGEDQLDSVVETMVVAMRARIAIGISCGALIIKGGTVAVIAEKSANINDPNKRIPIPWGK